ncbi:MAG: hypothetical protein JNK45_28500, partial [Myxococcales bacterium]|nr:hypothetical protein [Myxococcales bacterium]
LAGPGSSAPPQIEITAQARAQEPHGALTVRVASTGRPNGEPETLRRAKPHRRQRIDLVETDCRLGALD